MTTLPWSPHGAAQPATGERALARLLLLADSAFPTGAFAHSWGLEWAVRSGWVTDAASLAAWIRDALRFGVAPLEGRAVARARQLAQHPAPPERPAATPADADARPLPAAAPAAEPAARPLPAATAVADPAACPLAAATPAADPAARPLAAATPAAEPAARPLPAATPAADPAARPLAAATPAAEPAARPLPAATPAADPTARPLTAATPAAPPREHAVARRLVRSGDEVRGAGVQQTVAGRLVRLGDEVHGAGAEQTVARRLVRLSDEVASFLPSREAREAGGQLGRSLLTAAGAAFAGLLPGAGYAAVVRAAHSSDQRLQHPVAWGYLGAALGIDAAALVQSYLLGTARQWAQVAMRPSRSASPRRSGWSGGCSTRSPSWPAASSGRGVRWPASPPAGTWPCSATASWPPATFAVERGTSSPWWNPASHRSNAGRVSPRAARQGDQPMKLTNGNHHDHDHDHAHHHDDHDPARDHHHAHGHDHDHDHHHGGAVRFGIGGPVGSGKSHLLLRLCQALGKDTPSSPSPTTSTPARTPSS